MSDEQESGEVPLRGPPISAVVPMGPPPLFRVPQIHNHRPGEYCFFCWCQDCRRFYGWGAPVRCIDPYSLERNRPRYSYIGFVNCMRAAAAKREEIRQDKLRAEREGTAAAAEAQKKASKDQDKKKNLRQNMKRRRQ